MLGAQRVGPRAPAATRDDAAAAAASAAATQRALARVEASYENDDFELPDAPDFVRQLAIGVGRRIGTGRTCLRPPPPHVLPSTRGRAAAWRRACASGGCPSPSAATRAASRPSCAGSGGRAARTAGGAARFHATPAALDRVKIKASLALLRNDA